MKPLPIDSLLPELTATFRTASTLILEAPPGSGKTTRVAPALIDAGLASSQARIFLLQPRRVAARATAQRIADERNWRLGEDVGYQVRFENRSRRNTPLVVATEGILLRRITDDPTLQDVGCVILDEFHERSLAADLILGMLRRIQQVVRDDLRILIMSATIAAQDLSARLQAPVLSTTGTLHPVDVRYRPPKLRQSLVDHVAETVGLTVDQMRQEGTPGDLLVFLPGVGEIRRVQSLLQKNALARNWELHVLHGSLPLEDQNRVLQKGSSPRIILSTNVAETSLTIEGIQCVIDSGQVRVLRFQPDVGLDRLQLEPVCQSAADQRAGRAGRVQRGTCLRLWDQKSQRARPGFLEPEVCRVDLASTVLQLLSWGESPEGDFPWLERPREESLESAKRLLERLGATRQGQLTEQGRRLAKLPLSPRLARLLIEAEAWDAVPMIATVAAMIAERDPFLKTQRHPTRTPTRELHRWACDVTQRFFALRDYYLHGTTETPFGVIHRAAARSIQRVAEQLVREFGADTGPAVLDGGSDEDTQEIIQRCLLAGFPDRLTRRRRPGEAKGRMVGGRGVQLGRASGVTEAEFFLCVEVDAGRANAVVRLASSVDLSWLPAGAIETREEQFFNPTRKQVEARRRSYYDDLLLAESPMAVADEAQCCRLLLEEAANQWKAVLPDEKSGFSDLLTRVQCLRTWAPELDLPDCNDDLLREVARELCVGRRSFAELRDAPWQDWLLARLSPAQQRALDKECPERLRVPSGSSIRLHYEVGKPPVLAVRIQEVFSWTETPRLAFGRVPVLLHLLAPNMRPQQITDDLASFWANTYDVVRKELRRRYPKHQWPEDPRSARPGR